MAKVTGGDKLEAALNKIAAKLKKASSVQIGFPEGATESDGTSIPLIAAIEEFGAPSRGIPPRPFFRTMIEKNSKEWPDVLADLLKSTGYDAERSLNVLGKQIKGQLQQSIIDMSAPELSEVTVMLRGMRRQSRYRNLDFGELIDTAIARVKAGKTNYGASRKPLVDTGTMLKSITVTVNK